MLPHGMGDEMRERRPGFGMRDVQLDERVVGEKTSRSKCAPDQKSEMMRSIRKTMATDRPYGTVL